MTQSEQEEGRAREAARQALESGVADEPLAEGAELRPVAVETPERTPAGWVVGVVVGDRLAGFVQLDAGLRFRRYASFARAAGLEGSPSADDWLDRDTVLARARERLWPGESVADLYLGYDRSPDRVAWIVRVAGPEGEERTLLVAGEDVSELRSDRREDA